MCRTVATIRQTSWAAGLLLVISPLGALPGCGSNAGSGPNKADGAAGGSGGAQGSGGASGSGGTTGADTNGTGGAGGSSTDVSNPDRPASLDGATDGGDAGSDAATLTLPIARGDLDVLEFGSLTFKVKPTLGARITSFQLGGDELLTDATENAQYFGSTLWTSPADDWVGMMFAPPPIVDNLPYTTTVGADGVITSTNTAYTTLKNNKKFTITKVFHADLAKQSVVIDYKITNVGTTPYQLSHWEVTRVFPGGLTFFTTGTKSQVDFSNAGEPQVMQLKQAQGYTWYDNTTHMAGKGSSKSGSESTGGFIAHVAPHPGGDLLFVKAFKPIVPPATAPTGHYDIELFCNDPPTYIELEDHSSYDVIMPGATYTATVRWYLRRLPVGTDRSVGSPALIAAVKSLLGQ